MNSLEVEMVRGGGGEQVRCMVRVEPWELLVPDSWNSRYNSFGNWRGHRRTPPLSLRRVFVEYLELWLAF